MASIYFEEKSFGPADFAATPPAPGEYENCTFSDCDFSNADFSGYKFSDCSFVRCNLSLAKLVNTAFREVHFKDCKMLGLRFDDCNELGLSVGFEGCALRHATFYRKKLKNTIFKNTQLQETDFGECDLTGAVFNDCDLLDATFEETILEKADFRTAFNYAFDPEKNRIKKARFSQSGVAGLLQKYNIEIE
jgi:uncharacterized protein YjbI with pentapeptide repeats